MVGLVLLALVAVATVAARSVSALPRTAALSAIGRATLQLGVVALVLRLALEVPGVVVGFVALMLGAVALTAGGRLGGGPRVLDVLLASVCGAGPVVALVLLSGALGEVDRLLVVAFSGIVLGATMTSCTLTGRRLQAEVRERWPEVEGVLALGGRPRQAVLPFVPEVVREALLPGLDQTRTTGLVTLPGAFVGALAGGASPADAARFQLLVLGALMAAQAVTAVVLVRRLAVPVVALGPAEVEQVAAEPGPAADAADPEQDAPEPEPAGRPTGP